MPRQAVSETFRSFAADQRTSQVHGAGRCRLDLAQHLAGKRRRLGSSPARCGRLLAFRGGGLLGGGLADRLLSCVLGAGCGRGPFTGLLCRRALLHGLALGHCFTLYGVARSPRGEQRTTPLSVPNSADCRGFRSAITSVRREFTREHVIAGPHPYPLRRSAVRRMGRAEKDRLRLPAQRRRLGNADPPDLRPRRRCGDPALRSRARGPFCWSGSSAIPPMSPAIRSR